MEFLKLYKLLCSNEFQERSALKNGKVKGVPVDFRPNFDCPFLKTDEARTNRFLLLKQLTPKVHSDLISDDTTPSSGSSELIKFKLQTLSTFATVVRF